MIETRKLHVFLCHSSQDKTIVRELYQRPNAESWIYLWLDEEKLIPGLGWQGVNALLLFILIFQRSFINGKMKFGHNN